MSSWQNQQNRQNNARGGTATTQDRRQSRRQPGTVNIEIRGKRLALRTDHDPVFVHQLASYVDQKLANLQSMAPSAPFEKLMMLASLTLAEELFSAQGDLDGLRQDFASRTEAMLAVLEQERSKLDP